MAGVVQYSPNNGLPQGPGSGSPAASDLGLMTGNSAWAKTAATIEQIKKMKKQFSDGDQSFGSAASSLFSTNGSGQGATGIMSLFGSGGSGSGMGSGIMGLLSAL